MASRRATPNSGGHSLEPLQNGRDRNGPDTFSTICRHFQYNLETLPVQNADNISTIQTPLVQYADNVSTIQTSPVQYADTFSTIQTPPVQYADNTDTTSTIFRHHQYNIQTPSVQYAGTIQYGSCIQY